MKRILVFLFALMLLLPLCVMRAEAAEVIAEYNPYGTVYWRLTDNGVLTFTAKFESVRRTDDPASDWSVHKDKIKKVVFEGKITYLEGGAFYEHSNLKEVVFKGTVGEIQERAFYASGLEKVEFLYQVRELGNQVFAECKNLTTVVFSSDCKPEKFGDGVFEGSGVTSVTLPTNMTAIPSRTFAGCKKLTSFVVPNHITTIGLEAFQECTGLKKVVIHKKVEYFRKRAFEGAGIETLEIYTPADPVGNFNSNPKLKKVILGDKVTMIPSGAFSNCTSLGEVQMNGKVTAIGSSAFENCTALKSFDIPDGITVIDFHTFANTGLTEIKIPDSVTEIGFEAFSRCGELKTVTMSKNVKEIVSSVFSACMKLENIDLSKVQVIGHSAFSQCHALKSVDLSAAVEISDNAFYEAKGLESIVWPKNPAKIGNSAFEDCDSLKHVELPDTITVVPYFLFANCDNLETLVLSKSVTEIGGFPAVGCSKNTIVTVLNKDAEFLAPYTTDKNKGVLVGYAGSTTEAFAEKYSVTFLPIHDESHTYGVGKFITEIACGANGVMEFPCNDCDVVGQGIGWAPDHQFQGAGINTPPTCANCGAEHEGPYAIRMAGANRFDTACLVATNIGTELMKNQQFEAVVIASGAEFADALSGSYLANAKSAPILLAYKGELDEQTMDTIVTYLKPGGTVYILGGYAAVSEKVDQQLSAYTVKRLAGANRFETNLMILKEVGVSSGKEILVCTATNFADSLSGSATGLPILLVYNEKGVLTEDQKAYLADLKNCSFTIVGGENAVSNQLKTQLEAYGSVRRLAGESRFETSVLVAQTYFENPEAGVLAYAYNFPDGLCGGVLAHMLDAPLLLSVNEIDPSTRYVRSQDMRLGVVLGGGILGSDAAVRSVFRIDPNVEIPR